MKDFTHKRQGFTLIELLVVLAIIALIASIIFSVLVNTRARARDARRASDLASMQIALGTYQDEKGEYPSTPTSTLLRDITEISPYVQRLPVDPASGNGRAYRYFGTRVVAGENVICTSKCNGYVLIGERELQHGGFPIVVKGVGGSIVASTTDENAISESAIVNIVAFSSTSTTGGEVSSSTSFVVDPGVSVSPATSTVRTIEVPADTYKVIFQTSGGTGDVSLYARYNQDPDVASYTYDCGSSNYGTNEESCSVGMPAQGTWHVLIDNSTAVSASGVSLSVQFIPMTPYKTTVTVPAGARTLRVQLTGGSVYTGLYVRRLGEATVSQYDCFSDSDYSSDESCSIASPGAGEWNISLYGYEPSSGSVLTTEIIMPYTGAPTALTGAGPYMPGAAATAFNGTVDTSYEHWKGADRAVTKIVDGGGGTQVAIGDFEVFDGNSSRGIVRTNSSGRAVNSGATGNGFVNTIWPTLFSMNDIVKQADGKYLVSGYFTQYNGVGRNGLARLNSDLTLDTSFVPGCEMNIGSNREISTIALQSTGKIIIAGYYEGCGAGSSPVINRLNSDGSIDATFKSNIITWNWSATNIITKVIIQPDDKILVLGSFEKINGDTKYKFLARLNSDGTTDASFDAGNGPPISGSPQVSQMSLDPDGKILIAGSFQEFAGLPAGGVLRLTSSGAIDSTFDPLRLINKSSYGYDSGYPTAVVRTPSGKYMITGGVVCYNGTYTSISQATAINTDGTLDSASSVPDSSTAGNRLFYPYFESSTSMIMGADGLVIDGQMHPMISRISTSGVVDHSYAAGALGFDAEVMSVSEEPSGKLIVAGRFGHYGSAVTNSLARLNTDGTLDASFVSHFDSPSWSINQVQVLADGKILISENGTFVYDGVSMPGIARLNSDGSLDTTFKQVGWEGESGQFAVQANGRIIISGWNIVDGVSGKTTMFARLYPNGEFDPTFAVGNGLKVPTSAITLSSTGQVVISALGADDASAYGNKMIRYNADGSVDPSFVSSSSDGTISTIVFDTTGKIMVAGTFWNYEGVARKCLARLNSDGTLDTSFDPGPAQYGSDVINTVNILPGGKYLVSGYFLGINGSNQRAIARLNGDGSADGTFGLRLAIYDYSGSLTGLFRGSSGNYYLFGNRITAHPAATYGVLRMN